MKFAIVVSKKDPAGMNIKDKLLKYFTKTSEKFEDEFIYSYKNAKLYTVKKESIYNEYVDKKINADFFIFATKHQSKAKINSLSLHPPGNFSKAEFGGLDKKLCYSSALLQRQTFLILNENKIRDYEIVLEVTHHGPYLEKPCFFIEIGSSLEAWQDQEAGKIIAETIIKTISKEPEKTKVCMSIGGLHTCPEFNKVILRNKIAISHICPKYMLEFLDKDLILEMINKTLEKVDFVLIDYKGLGKEKQKIIELLKEMNLNFERTSKY